MDPIYTWLDPAAVRQLADQLLQPNREAAESPANDGFDDGFIGFDADPASLDIADASAAFVTGSPAMEVLSFAEKVERFSHGLRQKHSATGVFILDREGAVIFTESGHEHLHFLARSMALAPRRAGTSAGNVHVKISVGALLEMIPTDTLVLGAVVSEPLAAASVSEILAELAALG